MQKHSYKNPKKYSENNKLQYNFAIESLHPLLFDSQSRILDIGCGDGLITSELANIVKEGCVIGTDISAEMIEYASEKYVEQNNLRFIQMDARHNFFREQFDIVTSFNCLHWIHEQQLVLDGIAKACCKNAQIHLLLSHKKSLYHQILDALMMSDKWKRFFTHFVNPRAFFSLDHYKQMIERSSLKVVNITETERHYFFKTEEKLQDFFSAAGCQIKYIPQELKNEFLNDFSKAFLKQSNLQEGEDIPVGFWCLQILARKILL